MAPPGRYTDAELLARLDLGFLDQVAANSPGARLDDVAVTDLKRYRVITPVFSLTLPPDNLLGISLTPGEDPRLAAIGAGHFFTSTASEAPAFRWIGRSTSLSRSRTRRCPELVLDR